ncbi:HD-GYP domain-containing protein [Paenibacillus psychroresistens]|uniref:HD-GYP domain-containing protein n=1 Tax=Paenibacillus psychroresistens TaxID=1778678 RepID=A0A6B8RQ59_9BACL|nr:HD-GYP domain-containing protein [Paenibacillus psychroresistens]QGQ97832.1 HD-GYP domain-containing protein [Paenibacillus psychroresistens]
MRINVMELIEGDLLMEPAFNSYGLHILSESTLLNREDIVKLMNHGIDYVEIAYRENKSLEHKPAAKRNPEQTQKKYVVAVDGIKNVFKQAITDGKIDDDQVMNSFNPLVDNFKQEKDVVSLLLTLSTKDDYTYQHSVQVGILSYYISKWMGQSEEESLIAGKAGYLHDIGKSQISIAILNKPAKLTEDEYTEMKKHTVYGYQIISKSMKEPELAMAALQHHERFDGTGYPLAIKEDKMHALSKIVAVADIYSAMISSRVYQKERDMLHVLKELHRVSFSEIDPHICIVFIKNMLPHFIGKKVTLSNGEEGNIIMTNPTDFFRPLVQIGKQFIDLSHHREIEINKIYM